MTTELPNSLKEFLTLFEKYNSNGDSYFRGQSNFDWKITSSISRNINHQFFSNFNSIESELYKQFKFVVAAHKLQHLIPLVKHSYHSSWIYLMAAQHYGLPTRLLDFSHDKYSALEFAIIEITNLDKDGAFIVYKNPSSIFKDVDSELLKRPFKLTLDSFFFQAPQFANGHINELAFSERRKRIQGSKFLYCKTHGLFDCLSSDLAHSNELIKIKVPKSIKLELIGHLIKKNKIAYNQYLGKNLIDDYAAILKNGFYDVNKYNVKRFLNARLNRKIM